SEVIVEFRADADEVSDDRDGQAEEVAATVISGDQPLLLNPTSITFSKYIGGAAAALIIGGRKIPEIRSDDRYIAMRRRRYRNRSSKTIDRHGHWIGGSELGFLHPVGAIEAEDVGRAG